MKVMLLFPPNWTPSMPHLALPTLAGYLRAADVEVIQRDLNAEVFDRILTAGHLEKMLNRLASSRPRPGGPPASELAWARARGPRLIEEVEAAKATIRS